MKEFNQHNFDLRAVIQKRVNLEADVDWSRKPNIPIPRVVERKVERVPLSVGVWNLVRQCLP